MKIRLLYYSFYLFILVCKSCVPITPSSSNSSAKTIQKSILFENKIYDKDVGGVLIYNRDQITPPVIGLNTTEQITLEFDVFGTGSDYYQAKLIHCDANWNKTNIPDLQVLNEFNEFVISDFEFSSNTSIDYTHYTFQVPRTKISGNYLIAVYRNNDPNDLLLTRRFIITERIVSINANFEIPQQVHRRNNSQSLKISIQHENLRTSNPAQELTMSIRQNNRWDNAKTNLKSNNIGKNDNVLEFIAFDGETTFYGGNEFRFIDLRTTFLPGFNIGNIAKKENGIFANTVDFRPIRSAVYTQPINDDLNGSFFHATSEPGTSQDNTDYVITTFLLDTKSKFNYPIYVLGEFNGWKSKSSNEMKFNPESQKYQLTKFLKQGVYNFTFEGGSNDHKHDIDKSFRLTNNEYDIIIYQKAIGLNYDRIVGYLKLVSDGN